MQSEEWCSVNLKMQSKSMEDSYLILQIRGLKDHSHGPTWLLNGLVRSLRALSLHPSFNACLGGLLMGLAQLKLGCR